MCQVLLEVLLSHCTFSWPHATGAFQTEHPTCRFFHKWRYVWLKKSMKYFHDSHNIIIFGHRIMMKQERTCRWILWLNRQECVLPIWWKYIRSCLSSGEEVMCSPFAISQQPSMKARYFAYWDTMALVWHHIWEIRPFLFCYDQY